MKCPAADLEGWVVTMEGVRVPIEGFLMEPGSSFTPHPLDVRHGAALTQRLGLELSLLSQVPHSQGPLNSHQTQFFWIRKCGADTVAGSTSGRSTA